MNSTSSLSPLMQAYYDKVLLEYAKGEYVYWQFGQKRDLPANMGKTITFSRYIPLAAATTPLVEGTNPTGTDLSAENVTASLAEYGDYTSMSSLVSSTAIDANLKEKTELFSEQAGLTVDTIVRNALFDGTSQVIYANGKTDIANVAATDVMQTLDIQKGVRKLKKQKAKKINGHWICVIGADVEFDFTRDAAWVTASQYAGSTALYDGEIGRWFNTRFVYSTEPKIQSGAGSNGADVYSNFMFGQHAYGVVDFVKGSASGSPQKPQIIVKTPDSHSTNDPLNRFSTCGWQLTFTQKVLNPNWIVNIKCGVTPEA